MAQSIKPHVIVFGGNFAGLIVADLLRITLSRFVMH